MPAGPQVLFSLSVTDAVYEVGDRPLRDVVESLGGWPVLDADWAPKHEANWSLERILGRLRGVHNTPLLVETFVAADDKNSSMNVIQVVRLIRSFTNSLLQILRCGMLSAYAGTSSHMCQNFRRDVRDK